MAEAFHNLDFPAKGLDLRGPLAEQPPGTTPVGANVRLYESLTNRPRGGSRSGISKYIPGQPNGSTVIQNLAAVVTVSGEALGWSFEGRDFGDIGDLGIDYGPAAISGGPIGPLLGGGGGYQPSISFQEKRVQIVLSAEAPTWPADGSQLQLMSVTTYRNTSEAVFMARVVLETLPDGETGDGDLSISGISGQASFNVSAFEGKKVFYRATVRTTMGTIIATSNVVSVEYGGIEFIQARGGNFTQGTTLISVAFDEPVQAGDLLMACFNTQTDLAQPQEDTPLTDSLGNIYARAALSSFGIWRMGLWYCISQFAGPCTVAYVPEFASYNAAGVLAYRGASQDAPLFSTATDFTSSGPGDVQTSVVSVGDPGSMILGVFGSIAAPESGPMTLTPGSGYELRVSASADVSIFVVDKLNADVNEAATGTMSGGNFASRLGACFVP